MRGNEIVLDSKGEEGSKVRIGWIKRKGCGNTSLSPPSSPGNEAIVPRIIPAYICYLLCYNENKQAKVQRCPQKGQNYTSCKFAWHT